MNDTPSSFHLSEDEDLSSLLVAEGVAKLANEPYYSRAPIEASDESSNLALSRLLVPFPLLPALFTFFPPVISFLIYIFSKFWEIFKIFIKISPP